MCWEILSMSLSSTADSVSPERQVKAVFDLQMQKCVLWLLLLMCFVIESHGEMGAGDLACGISY